jgi:hypothetical protein
MRQGSLGDAVEYGRVILGPTQHPQPAALEAVLEQAVHAWDESNAELSSVYLDQAVQLAMQFEGYL